MGGSLAIVLVAYWAYALVAVPLIEPAASRYGSVASANREPNGSTHDAKEVWRKDLEGLFPAGAWELENPWILEMGQVKLLLRDYARLEGGQKVKLTKCTLIFTPEDAGAGAERIRRSIILQAPEGAVLEFDGPFDLRRARIGRLTSGQLSGQITIRSGGRSPGPEDDLLVVTRDVDLTEQRIWTPHPVDFRLGRNYGRGSQLWVKFSPRPAGEAARSPRPNIDGIELVELRHLERLHLEPDGSRLMPAPPTGGRPAPVAGQPSRPADGARPAEVLDGREAGAAGSRMDGRDARPTDLPIEITCRGPFQFDPIQQVARFQDQVDVLRIHPQGPSDQLNCETLSVFFAQPRQTVPMKAGDKPSRKNRQDKPAAKQDLAAGKGPAAQQDAAANEETASKEEPAAPDKKPDRKRPQPFRLYPRRIKAVGTPVVVRAPSEAVDARGEVLEYDFETREIVLDGSQEVFLQQGPNEIHGRRLRYRIGEPGRLGLAAAEGPGWLRAETGKDSQQMLSARWGSLLHLRPYEGQPVVSLTGEAEIELGDFGRLTAAEIHFFLNELPPSGRDDRVRVEPDRMIAQGQVQLGSAQLSGAVDQLRVWFEPAPQPAAQGDAAQARADQAQAGAVPHGVVGDASHRPSPGPPTRSSRPEAAASDDAARAETGEKTSLAGAVPAAPPPPQRHFEILGRLLQARVLIGGARPELDELTIEGNVRITETQTAQPGELPVALRGELVVVTYASQPYRTAKVSGAPAQFEGRGLGLVGPTISLDCGANQLRVDQPGWMDLPLDRGLDGRPLRQPGRLQVRWQGRMRFDGHTARFEGAVVASSLHDRGESTLSTEVLDVVLLRPVRFDQARLDAGGLLELDPAADQPKPDQPNPDRPEIERLLCRGGVLMENRSLEAGAQASHDRLGVADLAIELTSGQTVASGPGWMTSVHHGSAELFGPGGDRPATEPPPAAAAPDAADESQLHFLEVRFQGPATGNVRVRRMTFSGQVQCVYGPVESWESTLRFDDLEALGPRGVALSCQELSLADMPQPGESGRAMELAATGNVVAEGRMFTARAPRMTYAHAKQLLILEGDGRSDAQLYYQKRVGSPQSKVVAEKIWYWNSTKEVRVDRARSLQAN